LIGKSQGKSNRASISGELMVFSITGRPVHPGVLQQT